MKIELLVDLPIGPEHGMVAGKVLEVTQVVSGAGRGRNGWWVHSDESGEAVRVFTREAKVVERE